MSAPSAVTWFAVESSRDLLDRANGLGDPTLLLHDPEIARRASLANARDRDDFTAARLLTRLVLCHALGMTPSAAGLAGFSIIQRCGACGGPHGRPRLDHLPGMGVSWAHAGGIVAAAVGPGDVGVDVEPGGAEVRSWVRAEAVVKWGHGSLDEALTWTLGSVRAPRGRRYRLPDSGAPTPWPRPHRPGGRSVVITDGFDREARAQCAVAAAGAARLVRPVTS